MDRRDLLNGINDFLSDSIHSVFLAPRIGCLNFHSLLELRRGLQYGAHIVCVCVCVCKN